MQSVNDSVVNQARLASRQQAVAHLAGADSVPLIALRVTHAVGRLAEEVNGIDEQQQAFRTPPSIPDTSSASKAK